jgi:alginate O-acetyltransferase complex protein AlgI
MFNSYLFIFIVLPVSIAVFFCLNHRNLMDLARTWLVFVSLFLYGWWNVAYVPLLIFSVLINFGVVWLISEAVEKKNQNVSKNLVVSGIIFNIVLLGCFKYADFFIENINSVLNAHISLLHISLPLGISFFTFTQIACLIDAYRGETKDHSLLNYLAFVTFFPNLIAGPIARHRDMTVQFGKKENAFLDYNNVAQGIFIFAIGLFKKVVIADAFAPWVDSGFNNAESLTFLEAWSISLSYTFQLYFDFSGYSDMAIGIGKMLNINLPINFNSPYKALSIQDFWRRWHITLSGFLRDYIYIPLGGSRNGTTRTYINFMITFLIAGIWHGAGWTFVLWGGLHGAALIVNAIWKKTGLRLNGIIAWLITFNFVNVAWVFFRARTIHDSLEITKALFGLKGITISPGLSPYLGFLGNIGVTFGPWGNPDIGLDSHSKWTLFILIFSAAFVTLLFENSIQLKDRFVPGRIFKLGTVSMLVIALINMQKISNFIYAQF